MGSRYAPRFNEGLLFSWFEGDTAKIATTIAGPASRLRNAMDGTTVYVLLVVLIATLIRSAFGFGEALIAVPLLALRIPITVAAPLAVVASITVAVVIVLQDWEKIHVRSMSWLVLSTLAGKLLVEEILGSSGHFDLFAALEPPPFPGGIALRGPLHVLGMLWYALRDRL